MRYVRDRLAPASREQVRKRREANRAALAPGRPARFWPALDWFRAAAVYAERRSYRSQDIRNSALARREQIIGEAAAVIQEHADRISAVAPVAPRRRLGLVEIRGAYRRAATNPDRLDAARAWLMFIDRQAGRAGGEAATRADAIKDEAAARLIEWAEEMDADDYGE